MKFSFEGSFEDLHELGRVLSKAERVEIPVTIEPVGESVLSSMKEDLQTAPADEPQMDISESFAKDPCIDPTTGEYFTAFKEMMAACDELIKNNQQKAATDLIKANSKDGTYGGIPPRLWGLVKDQAKALLIKKDTSVTLNQLKELATEYTHANPKENRQVLKDLLNKYGAKGISTIPNDQRATFYDELKALHEGA